MTVRRVTPGIVHLGVGAFHRAHQAAYIDDCWLRAKRIGASSAPPCAAATRDALAPQEGLYTLDVRRGRRKPAHRRSRPVEVAARNPAALIARMADPATRIVSLTITEKGYCHSRKAANWTPPSRHRPRPGEPATPRTAIGFLAAALSRRQAAGIPPFTVLCCDNLPANGHTVGRIVTQFAALRSRDLANGSKPKCAFPSTMVDRIVPETTDIDRAEISSALGMTDAWPVVTEPFSQWIVEDRFSGRPAGFRGGGRADRL